MIYRHTSTGTRAYSSFYPARKDILLGALPWVDRSRQSTIAAPARVQCVQQAPVACYRPICTLEASCACIAHAMECTQMRAECTPNALANACLRHRDSRVNAWRTCVECKLMPTECVTTALMRIECIPNAWLTRRLNLANRYVCECK